MAFPLTISLDDDPDHLQETIVSYCQSPDRRTIYKCGDEVVRLNPALIVKFGHGVYEDEADNQAFAWERLDDSIVRVPEPWYFFEQDNCGYLVMDWLDYRPVGLDDIEAVARAVIHMQSVPCGDVNPGSVSGGVSVERFDETVEFKDKQDLQDFLNDRLLNKGPAFSLGDQPLVLTHLDVAPRNLGISSDGTVCIIDWAFAGFFPRWFENGMLEACGDLLPGSNEFKQALSKAMELIAPLTPTETDDKYSLMLAVWNCVGTAFRRWNDPPLPPDYVPKKKKKILNGTGEPYVPVPLDLPDYIVPLHLRPGWSDESACIQFASLGVDPRAVHGDIQH